MIFLYRRNGCNSSLRKKISEPSHCNRILPRRGHTSNASFTTEPLTLTVMRVPSQMHSTSVHSWTGLSTSRGPRKSSTSFQRDDLPNQFNRPQRSKIGRAHV